MDENYIENMITNEYYAVFDEREGIVGYFCLGEEARVPSGYRQGVYVGSASVMDIGIGMRPDLTGKGLGGQFFYCLEFVKSRAAAYCNISSNSCDLQSKSNQSL
jgi:hypothetical protein